MSNERLTCINAKRPERALENLLAGHTLEGSAQDKIVGGVSERGAGEASLVSEGVLVFLRCRNIDIYGVHKNVKFLRLL